MLINQTVKDFINEVDSSSPAPGGGSVSAFVSTLGSALSRMVGHLTISKKLFAKLDEKIQKELISTMDEIEIIQAKLVFAIDEDTNVFQKMMEAYGLKKETEDEKRIRSEAIQKATIAGIEVPLSVMKNSFEILKRLEIFIKHGNKSAISDVGVGIHLLIAGMEGALLNVKINLSSLKDVNQKQYYINETNRLMNEAHEFQGNFLQQINDYLNQSML